MPRNLPARMSRRLALAACLGLISSTAGCSIPSFGPFTPLIKLGYNVFATMFNSTFFGTGTSTGITF